MAKTVDLVIRPVLDAVTVRPGDKLIVRIAGSVTMDLADRLKKGLEELLPGVEPIIIAADQILVYRDDDADPKPPADTSWLRGPDA